MQTNIQMHKAANRLKLVAIHTKVIKEIQISKSGIVRDRKRCNREEIAFENNEQGEDISRGGNNIVAGGVK